MRWWGSVYISPCSSLVASRSISPETPAFCSGLTAGIVLAGLFETLWDISARRQVNFTWHIAGASSSTVVSGCGDLESLCLRLLRARAASTSKRAHSKHNTWRRQIVAYPARRCSTTDCQQAQARGGCGRSHLHVVSQCWQATYST